tara:strand:- start:715 stop:999 length:285 start_codon:yes stop_codon:yes gene_type:complete
MSESRTPAEILKDTKFVIVQYQSNITAYRYFCFATVEFFNDNDEPIVIIKVSGLEVDVILNYIIKNHDEITVYDTNLSNILIPSTQKLYELILD